MLASLIALTAFQGAWGQPSTEAVSLQRAAREGNLQLLRARLEAGADPNQRDAAGQTALLEAVSGGQLEAIRVLLTHRADVNAKSKDGRTPLIEAAVIGQLEAARLLVESGADLNWNQRGTGSAVDAADRTGHTEVAAFLRQAGARSATGRSVGDTVCVRPWKGDGYCGTVESVNRTAYTIRVTRIVGCTNGCTQRAECSAGKPVGGTEGIRVGDEVNTFSWCLTHTGVQQ